MALEEFLRSTIALIAAIAALVGAVATLIKVIVELIRLKQERRERLLKEKGPIPPTSSPVLRRFLIATLVLAILGGGIFWARATLPPPPPPPPLPPSVTITAPIDREAVEVRLASTGSGAFTVSGTSSGVFSDPELRLFVLVHPSKPYAPGWWIQQEAIVDPTGSWTAECWIGSPQFPPGMGNEVDIIAIAALPDPLGRTQIPNPKVIKPAAQSNRVHFSIGSLKPAS
jgi:hypothetical protein